MECQDYLSFSQKPTKTLRPPPAVCYNALSEIIPEPANISDVFASTHYILSNNLYICETLPKKDEIKSLKAKRI